MSTLSETTSNRAPLWGGAVGFFRSPLRLVSFVLCALFVSLFGVIFLNSIAGWRIVGWTFFTNVEFRFPYNLGGLSLIVGTLYSTFLALLLSVPLAIGSAVATVFVVPRRLSVVAMSLTGSLAAIPSIVYGLWGIIVVGHYCGFHLDGLLVSLLHGRWPAYGIPHTLGLLPVAIVLAVMLFPIIASVSVDVLRAVPTDVQEAAVALGATKAAVVRKIVLPKARKGLVGAVLLGAGRALGETIAVAFIFGGQSRTLPLSLFSYGQTLSTAIYQYFYFQGRALQIVSVFAVMLFVIVGASIVLGRRIIARQIMDN